jgi:hypothetical protein
VAMAVLRIRREGGNSSREGGDVQVGGISRQPPWLVKTAAETPARQRRWVFC